MKKKLEYFHRIRHWLWSSTICRESLTSMYVLGVMFSSLPSPACSMGIWSTREKLIAGHIYLYCVNSVILLHLLPISSPVISLRRTIWLIPAITSSEQLGKIQQLCHH